jgi:hypothetical protein
MGGIRAQPRDSGRGGGVPRGGHQALHSTDANFYVGFSSLILVRVTRLGILAQPGEHLLHMQGVVNLKVGCIHIYCQKQALVQQ